MLFIPLPFAIATLLLLIFSVGALRDGALALARPFRLLILVCAVQSILVGLRWGYGIPTLQVGLSLLGALLPPLVYLGAVQLARGQEGVTAKPSLKYFVPVIIVLLEVLLWPRAIDLSLIALSLGFSIALLRLIRRNSDTLQTALLQNADPLHHAIQSAAFALFLMAIIDFSIFLDFELYSGGHAPGLATLANLLALLFLAIAASVADHNAGVADSADLPAPTGPSVETEKILGTLDGLMTREKLYRDVNLTLIRLARKAGIPARDLSAAINRGKAKNVSQYVNDFRVAEACRLLAQTTKSITDIMFEAGFQTKSNFNREFRRVTGTNPVSWRTENRAQDGRTAGANTPRPV